MNNFIKTLSATVAFSAIATSAFAQESSISLPGERLFPEGIATTTTGDIFVGSFVGGYILKTNSAGETQTFTTPGQNGLVSVVGLMADERANLLYACSSDPGVGNLTGSAAPALTAFDLSTGASRGRYELPGGGFCNDITQADDGSIYVTDSFNPRILKLNPSTGSFEEWVRDDRFAGEGFNLNGLAALGNSIFAVKYNTGQLYKINMHKDGTAGAIEELAMSRPLQNPDGLIAFAKNELLVVEGAGTVSKICVKDGSVEIQSVASSLNVPTSVAVSRGNGYVVQSQFDHLFDPETAKTSPDTFELSVITLR